MIKLRAVSFGVLVVLVLAGIQPGEARSDDPPQGETMGGTASWIRQVIDNPDTITGLYSDIAIDPVTHTPYISYYNQGTGTLMLAKKDASYGNCGPGNTWNCSLIYPVQPFTQRTSIDVRTIDGTTHVVVAFVDILNSALKLFHMTCTETCNNSVETVDVSAEIEAYASVKLDDNGKASIAYVKNGSVRYATRVDVGGIGCNGSTVPGRWNCELVNFATAAQYVSLDLDQNAVPHIGYYQAESGFLSYAWREPSMTCEEMGNWTCQAIDGGSVDVGRFVSFHASKGEADRDRVAYYDLTNGKLKYAEYVGSEGNCGSYDAFNCTTIDDMAVDETHTSIDMEVVDLKPYIAYHYATGAPVYENGLKVARPVMGGGNCVPISLPNPPYYINRWLCETVESAGILRGTGLQPAIAGDTNGMLFVSYQRTTSNINGQTDGYLKLAFQGYRAFLPGVIR